MLNLTKIRAIDAVGHEKSFSKAAARLGVSQPAVSQQLRELESAYDVKLFLRRGNRIELTPLAMEAVDKARSILAHLGDLEASLAAGNTIQSTPLRVGTGGGGLVSDLLAEFVRRFPEHCISSKLGDAMDLVQRVLDGQLDIAIVTTDTIDPRLKSQLYGRHKIVALVADQAPFSALTRLEVDELNCVPMITRGPGCWVRGVFERRLIEAGVEPRRIMETDSLEAMLNAVSAGLGFAVALESDVRGRADVRMLEISGKEMIASQYLVCLPEFIGLKSISSFLAFAAIEAARLTEVPQPDGTTT